MDFPFSYLFPDVADSLRSLRRSLGSNPHFEIVTVISPDKTKIPLPLEFWALEKDRLLVEGSGYIRDDYANYFKVLIREDVDGGCLIDGSIISLYCGFKQPQKVSLSYQLVDNEFRMKILDNAGQEMKYLGLSYPEDQQTIRNIDPDCVFESTFVNTALAGSVEAAEDMLEDDGLNFGFNILEGVPVNAGQVRNDIPEVYFTWEVTISRSLIRGRNVLHIPKKIADRCFPLSQDSVVMVNQDTEQLYMCTISTSYLPGRRTRRIGRGWYCFAKDANLDIGDKIIFKVSIAPEFLLAQIIRCPPEKREILKLDSICNEIGL